MAEAVEAVETTVAGVADPANDPANDLAGNPAGILTLLLMSRIPHILVRTLIKRTSMTLVMMLGMKQFDDACAVVMIKA